MKSSEAQISLIDFCNNVQMKEQLMFLSTENHFWLLPKGIEYDKFITLPIIRFSVYNTFY